MSNSKLLPSFTFDVLCYLNRNQLERFSIVCHPLRNLVDRYFHLKPYRIFDRLYIRRGLYALSHNRVQWHPNQSVYSVQQFLANRKFYTERERYSFVEMRPYLCPNVRIKTTYIFVASYSTYPVHIAEMESISYLWRDGDIRIQHANGYEIVGAKDFQSILNSLTIIQCNHLHMVNANFSFKDYKILYTLKVIETLYFGNDEIDHWLQYWQQFLEQPGIKPIVVFSFLRRDKINSLFGRISKSFSSAVMPNAFKIAFVQDNEPLTEFRETNNTSNEILELKKGNFVNTCIYCYN